MRNVGAKLPRRVLDVRNNHVRLHETTNTDQGTRYACLSHCWGIDSSATLRTTTFNLKAHRKEIPCSGLPRTFRDAVSFTRRLNVDFLWIDSLCIIQNDARDWQQQSANMAAIYKNGYITLAATSSYNAEGGCYTQKNGPPSHQVIGPPVAVLRYPDGTEGPIFVRRTFKHAQTSFPLLQRGWVFQERLLSPRILHFADEELIWECKQSVRCECGSTETKNGFSRISAYVEERETPFSNLEPLSKQNHALASWNLVVSDYAACSLTYQRDAFPALSGIAKVFAASLQDEYVAGLWKSTLVSQLLWYFRSINGETVTKVNTWRAPSWSWVSVNWRYKFLTLPVTKELAELKHVVCKASGDDPTGELQTAYLTLRTRVIPATLGHVLNGGLSSYHLYLGNELVFPRKSIPRFYSLDDAETGYFDLSDHRLANDITSLGVVVAQVASWSGIRTIYIRGHVPDEVRFYLLLARDIKDNRHWVRIGLMVVTAYNRNVSLCYCANQNSMTSEQKAKEFEERKHEISSHPIFDLFDEAEAQDITIW
ncbi:HET-domain-containing protein [Ophiobolus disseminans]|uniref:HET-domain-containing protein n=1 Tax=Ophiobolus disseminans TaxID=1469910 RepID=A0A6A6ZW99_9PLEO|nr:HET-domain-containing protein [Ophiobolus disseminans]